MTPTINTIIEGQTCAVSAINLEEGDIFTVCGLKFYPGMIYFTEKVTCKNCLKVLKNKNSRE